MAHSFCWSTALEASSAEVEGKTVEHLAGWPTVFGWSTALEAFSAVLHQKLWAIRRGAPQFFGQGAH